MKVQTGVALAVVALLLMHASSAQAFPNTGQDFSAMYPQSQTDNNGSCATCHETTPGSGSWNAYGIALKLTPGLDFGAIEGLDSDGDGFTNLFEIMADTQPGWCDPLTVGCDNRAFDGSGMDVGPATPPAGIPLDPGAAQAPEIDVAPLALGFGSITVGNVALLSTTISNLGDADLTVTALTLGGSADFSLEAGAPSTPFIVPASGSIAIPVQYLASDAGGDSGTLDIGSDDADEPNVMVSLDGNGTPPVVGCDIDVVGLALDFGAVEVGSSASLSTTIGNTGSADCVVSQLALSGSFDFGLGAAAPATPFTIAPSTTVDVPLDYAPSEVGGDSGMLSIASDDTDEPTVDVALAGSGFIVPDMGDIDVSPPLLDFGFVSVGSAGTRTVTISNLGAQDLTVTGLTTGGSTDFALGAAAPIPPFTVPANSSVAVPVSYAPSVLGAAAGALDVASDDVTTPNVGISLSGFGVPGIGVCDIDVDPLPIEFGDVEVGSTASLQTTIGNTGDAECVVAEISLSGSPEFALGAGAPAAVCAIAPTTSVHVPVDYTPADVGGGTATLSVLSSDPDEARVDVPVTGAGVRTALPDIDVSPLLLDFGTVTLGGAVTRTATISNLGDADLAVTDLALRGSADFVFGTAAPQMPFTVPAAGSVDVPVDYVPTDVGSDAGALDITSDDPDEPNVMVALTGVGVDPAQVCDIDVNPLALDFGSVEVGSSATLSTTVANSGDVDCMVDRLVLSGSPDFALGAAAPTTPFMLAAMTFADVPVDYAPSGIGADNATLSVGSDDPDQPTVAVSVAGSGTMPPDPPTGKMLYDNNCGFCHGDFDNPPTAAPQKVLGARTCSIDGAIDGTSVFPGGVPAMQFLQGLLSPDEIDRIAGYLNSRPVTGQERYVTACAGCHGLDGSGGRTDEDVRGDDAGSISEAIHDESEMRFLRCLPAPDIDAMGGYLEMLDDDDHTSSSASGRAAGLLLGAGVSGIPQCVPEPGLRLLAAVALATIAGLRRRRH